MPAMSNYLERQLASHLFGSGTYTKPSVLAIALTSTPPVASDTGALTSKELANAGAYARQTLNPSAANWLDPVTGSVSGLTNNIPTVTFPTATADWGAISGIAICDSATYGAGNMLVYGSLATPKRIDNADVIRFASGDLAITLS